jgi:hypothetical protein
MHQKFAGADPSRIKIGPVPRRTPLDSPLLNLQGTKDPGVVKPGTDDDNHRTYKEYVIPPPRVHELAEAYGVLRGKSI